MSIESLKRAKALHDFRKAGGTIVTCPPADAAGAVQPQKRGRRTGSAIQRAAVRMTHHPVDEDGKAAPVQIQRQRFGNTL